MFISYWWLLALLPLVGGAAGYYYSYQQSPVYRAQATLLVQQRRSGSSPGVSDFNISQQLAVTYARLVGTTPFLSTVVEGSDLPATISELKTSELKGIISATTASGPPTVTVQASSDNPQLAADAADTVARQFMDYVIEQRLAEIGRLQAAAAAQGLSDVQGLVAAQFTLIDSLSLLEPVVVPDRPILPRTRQNIILGVFLGILLAGGGALLLSTLSDTVRNPDDIPRRFGLSVLGTIFRWSSQAIEDSELVVWKLPSSGFSESFRQLRANLQFSTANTPGSVYLVTSPGPGDGKSTILCNLAITIAQSGKRVVIVDGDMRRPSVHTRFEAMAREPGLSNFLGGEAASLSEVIHQTEMEGVSAIPGGPIPPNPSELLGSPRMKSLLEELKTEADVILVDSPPVLVVADGPILAAQTDGVIMVVDGFNTRSGSLAASLETLKKTQVSILGVVINKMKRARFGYGYGYGYSYYYKYDYYYYTYYTADSDKAQANRAGPFYKRPARWVRSVLTRNNGPRDQA